MPYTFVNSILQMNTSSRAEGEAIVSIANDPRTTNTPHGKRERTTRGRSQPAQTERSGEEGGRGDRGSPHGAQRSPRSDCPRTGEGAEGATKRGETEAKRPNAPARRAAARRAPQRQTNDKHPTTHIYIYKQTTNTPHGAQKKTKKNKRNKGKMACDSLFFTICLFFSHKDHIFAAKEANHPLFAAFLWLRFE